MTDQDQEQTQAQQQAAIIKQCYEDGSAEINGNKYEFHKMAHKQRRKVFSYLMHVRPDLERQDFWFLDSPDFEAVEAVINSVVTVNGSLLSKKPDHWENHPEDYLKFITTALAVISYPFLKGGLTS